MNPIGGKVKNMEQSRNGQTQPKGCVGGFKMIHFGFPGPSIHPVNNQGLERTVREEDTQ